MIRVSLATVKNLFLGLPAGTKVGSSNRRGSLPALGFNEEHFKSRSARSNLEHFRSQVTFQLARRTESPVLNYDHSLDYIDNPNIVFKHPRAEFLMSCTSDYKLAVNSLDIPESSVFPVYIPQCVLGDRRLDVELIESLKRDFFRYAEDKLIYGEKEIMSASTWAVVFSLFPDIPYARRLVAIKFLLFVFIFDDPLEEMIANQLVDTVAEPYLENIRKIATDSQEPLMDLMTLNNPRTKISIELALRSQNLMIELMLEFKAVLTPKVFDLYCKMNDANYEYVKREVRVWASKMPTHSMANREERISCKHVSTGLPLVYYPMLQDEDIDFHPIGSYFAHVSTMAECDNNDLFSYFKEEYDTQFLNVLNTVGIRRAEGLNQKQAFIETIKSRNELFRSIEVGLENLPVKQRLSCKKALIALLGTTHYHFTNERYGWIPTKSHPLASLGLEKKLRSLNIPEAE